MNLPVLGIWCKWNHALSVLLCLPYLASLVAQRLKHLPPMRENWVWSLSWEDPLEKEMTTHSSILAWRIPWTEEPGRPQSLGSQRVRHDWATSLSLLFYLAYFQSSIHAAACIRISFLLRLNNISLYVYTTLNLSIHLLTGIWVILCMNF